MQATAAQIASAVGGVVDGDPSAVVSSLSALSDAREGSLTFLTNAKYSDLLDTTKATVVVVKSDWTGTSSAKALVRVQNPDRGFAIAATLVAPPPPARPAGIHPTAYVAPTAKIGANVHIGPMAVIQDGATIGDDSVVEAQCFIGEDVVIGKEAHIYPQVTIRERVRIGDRFIAHCGVRLGCDGFGYAVEMLPSGLPRIDKIPQVGTVVIGNDVEIGANTCIDRARFGETYIGDSVKIDNLVQIGHNVRINAFSGVVAQAGIAGSTTVGSGVKIWSQAGVSGHLHIADGAQVGPQCGVTKDVPPGAYVIGSPEMSMRNFIGIKEAPQQISKLRMRVAKLEREASNKDGKENA